MDDIIKDISIGLITVIPMILCFYGITVSNWVLAIFSMVIFIILMVLGVKIARFLDKKREAPNTFKF